MARYLLSSRKPFRLSLRILIELYRRGSKFVLIDHPINLEEAKREMSEYTSEDNILSYLHEDGFTEVDGHVIGFDDESLAARSCPVLLQIVEELGLKAMVDRLHPATFRIVEIPNNIGIEFCTGDYGHRNGGDFIQEKHRIWHVSDRKE